MKKKILFRADGNSEIGLGHLYRLFSLVEMLKDNFKFIFLFVDSLFGKVSPENKIISGLAFFSITNLI